MSALRKDLWIYLGIASLIPFNNLYAAAFALNEQNTSGLGNAYAGRTAIAEDASTSFYNPAALVKFNKVQVVGSAVGPLANFDARMNSATRANGAVLTTGKTTDNAAVFVPMPAFHIAGPINNTTAYGLSVTAPFGLATDYSDTSRFRFFATRSELKTIDVNPNIAFKIDNQWSVGAGVSAQYAQAILARRFDNIGFAATGDGNIKIKGDDIGFGYNFGAWYQTPNSTKLGLAFRSKVKHDLKGKVDVRNINAFYVAAASLFDQDATASVTLPEVASISAFQSLTTDWDVMGDITYTNWHRFKKLVVKFPDSALSSVIVEEKFKDVFKFALGANYRCGQGITWKFGAAYDQSPVKDDYRTFRVPDSDRYWLSAGMKYNVYNNLAIDLGYSHIFLKNAKINETPIAAAPLNLATSNAKVKAGINLFGLQLTYDL